MFSGVSNLGFKLSAGKENWFGKKKKKKPLETLHSVKWRNISITVPCLNKHVQSRKIPLCNISESNVHGWMLQLQRAKPTMRLISCLRGARLWVHGITATENLTGQSNFTTRLEKYCCWSHSESFHSSLACFFLMIPKFLRVALLFGPWSQVWHTTHNSCSPLLWPLLSQMLTLLVSKGHLLCSGHKMFLLLTFP